MKLTLYAHRGGGHRGSKLRARESCDSRVLESLMSVAEVGEKHLPGVVEVSREASQEGAG